MNCHANSHYGTVFGNVERINFHRRRPRFCVTNGDNTHREKMAGSASCSTVGVRDNVGGSPQGLTDCVIGVPRFQVQLAGRIRSGERNRVRSHVRQPVCLTNKSRHFSLRPSTKPSVMNSFFFGIKLTDNYGVATAFR